MDGRAHPLAYDVDPASFTVDACAMHIQSVFANGKFGYFYKGIVAV